METIIANFFLHEFNKLYKHKKLPESFKMIVFLNPTILFADVSDDSLLSLLLALSKS